MKIGQGNRQLVSIMEHKNYVSQVFEMTWNVSQVWNSVLDVFWKRNLLVVSEDRVMFMVTVSLGCRRLAQNLVLVPASMTAGMATMYCLQPQIHTHTYIYIQDIPLIKRNIKKIILYHRQMKWINSAFLTDYSACINGFQTYGSATAWPPNIQLKQTNSTHSHVWTPGRPMTDWQRDELQGHNITVSAARPHPLSLAYMTGFSKNWLLREHRPV